MSPQNFLYINRSCLKLGLWFVVDNYVRMNRGMYFDTSQERAEEKLALLHG